MRLNIGCPGADGRSCGRCTVTWLPNFLRWIDFLSYGQRHRGRVRVVEMAPVKTDANLFLFQKGNFLFRHHNGGNYSPASKMYPFFLLLFVFNVLSSWHCCDNRIMFTEWPVTHILWSAKSVLSKVFFDLAKYSSLDKTRQVHPNKRCTEHLRLFTFRRKREKTQQWRVINHLPTEKWKKKRRLPWLQYNFRLLRML